MELLKSNKGNDKIALDGYTYTIKKTCQSIIRWKCSKKSSMKCPAILITDLKMTKIVRFEEEHCHSANKGAIGAMKIKQKIKECSLQTCNNPGQIFAQAVQSVPKEVLIELPSEDSIKRSIRNQRSSLNPKIPNSLQELVIEGNLHYLLL
ncbi:uncharacterized protein LOC112591528 [Melanaphis sacchari]|uniref:uncharacterized protein LOC112591528 n=1 Tax=Melanaphis sacchari TaxID=742174 RepID=UPI000DC14471|nr:uncharacterized protein LOC112591528 [Melanaphis sacchari]